MFRVWKPIGNVWRQRPLHLAASGCLTMIWGLNAGLYAAITYDRLRGRAMLLYFVLQIYNPYGVRGSCKPWTFLWEGKILVKKGKLVVTGKAWKALTWLTTCGSGLCELSSTNNPDRVEHAGRSQHHHIRSSRISVPTARLSCSTTSWLFFRATLAPHKYGVIHVQPFQG